MRLYFKSPPCYQEAFAFHGRARTLETWGEMERVDYKSVSAHRRTDMTLSDTNLCLTAVAVTLNISLVAEIPQDIEESPKIVPRCCFITDG